MSYMHIINLGIKTPEILNFKWLYSLEKIHGTSAHLYWRDGKIGFFSGGESYEKFKALFNEEELTEKFREKFGGFTDVTIFGEAYGGKQQGMSETYGKELRFIAFEVKIGESWLSVPQAFDCAGLNLGFPFVHFVEIPADMDAINAERDAPSVQAVRNGILEPKPREGIVLRPPFECTLNNGARIIAKHKNEAFSERKSKKDVDPTKIVELQSAQAVADEFVTAGRMLNAKTHFTEDLWKIENLSNIIKYVVDDVIREGSSEISDSKEVRKAVARKTAIMFKQLNLA